MRLFCNRMWGLPLVRQVDRHCVLIWEPFLCFSALLWMTLCAFADVNTTSMMCGTLNGVEGGTVTGCTICGSTMGVFLRVVYWWVLLVPAWRICFDVGLLATIVGGALLTLWMSGIVVWLLRSFTLCSVCSSTLCSGLGGGVPLKKASRCRASILRTRTVLPFHPMVTIFSWSSADSSLTCDSGEYVGSWQCCGNNSANLDTLYPFVSGT